MEKKTTPNFYFYLFKATESDPSDTPDGKKIRSPKKKKKKSFNMNRNVLLSQMKERVEAAFAAQDLNLDQAKPNNSDSITKPHLPLEHEKNESDEPKTIDLENKELPIDDCEETEIIQNDSDKNTSDTHHTSPLPVQPDASLPVSERPSTSLSLLAMSYSEEPDVSIPEEDSFAKSIPEIQAREPDITTSKEPYDVTPLKEPEMTLSKESDLTLSKETDVILSKETIVAPSKEPDMKLSKESDEEHLEEPDMPFPVETEDSLPEYSQSEKPHTSTLLLKETDLTPKQDLLKTATSPKFSLYTCGQTRSDMLKTALQTAALMKQKAELEAQAQEETEEEIAEDSRPFLEGDTEDSLPVSEEIPEQSDVIKPAEPEHLEEPDMPFPVETEDSLPEYAQSEKPHTSTTLLSEPILSSQENSIMSMSDISDVPLPVSETEDSLPFPEEVEDSRPFPEVETEDSLPVTETEDSQSETPVISKASSPLPVQPDASLPVSERPEWGKPLLPSSEESSNDGAPENNMKLKNTILRTCFASLYRRQKLEKEQEYKDHLNGGLD